MRRWPSALRLLGNPAALSQRSAALTFLLSLTAIFGSDLPRFGTSLPLWLMTSLLGQVLLALVYLAGQRILFGAGQPHRSPALVLVVICAGVTVRTTTFILTASALGLMPGVDPQMRILAGVVGGSMLGAFFAIVVAEQAQHQQLVASLTSQGSRLTQLEGSLASRIEELRWSLRETVRATVVPNLRQVEQILAGLGDGRDRAVAIRELRQVIDRDFRALSHQIAEPAAAGVDLVDTADATDSSTPAWPRSVALGSIGAPVAGTVVLFIMLVLFAQTSVPRPAALTFAAIGAGLIGLTLALARFVLRGVRIPTLLTVPLLVPASMLVAFLLSAAMRSFGIGSSPDLRLTMAFGTGIVAALQASYSLLLVRRSTIEADLAAVVAGLERSVMILRQEEWRARRQLAAVLHGSVQSALHSAAIRLSLVDHVDAALLEDIRRDLQTAVGRLDQPAGAADVQAELEALASLWADACRVAWSIEPEAGQALADRPALSECTAEILREGIGNAVRHGAASSVHVRIFMEGGAVSLVVQDNGSGPGGCVESGLGSKLLDELSLRWSLCRTDAGTELRALVSA